MYDPRGRGGYATLVAGMLLLHTRGCSWRGAKLSIALCLRVRLELFTDLHNYKISTTTRLKLKQQDHLFDIETDTRSIQRHNLHNNTSDTPTKSTRCNQLPYLPEIDTYHRQLHPPGTRNKSRLSSRVTQAALCFPKSDLIQIYYFVLLLASTEPAPFRHATVEAIP